jgi:xanthine dehydrogenase YagS FAD-binding subunit
MKRFTHIAPATVAQAVAILEEYQGEARVVAGGSDLMGGLKDNLWPRYPKAVVTLKGIPGLRDIRAGADGLHIGALVTLTELAESPVVRDGWPGLAEAARRTGSPLLRNIGTIAGNICQENRCWYYRYPHKLGGRIDCVRKGGSRCLAVTGDHRYHSIFGAVKKCIAVNPSDTAPALVALAAVVTTSKRDIPIDGFFSAEHGLQSTVLDAGEIVTGVFVPRLPDGGKSAFIKIAIRKSIDFALVNCSAAVTCRDGVVRCVRICLNGVHNNPRRCEESEAALLGRPLNAATAAEAGELAVAQARPLLMNTFKVPMARTIVADTLLACA